MSDMETLIKPEAGARGQVQPDRSRLRKDLARAVLARDAALERIARARRWVVVGSVALTGALAGLASALLPGKSFGATKSESAARTTPSAPSPSRVASTSLPPLPAPAGPAQLGLSGTRQSLPPVQSSPPPAPAPAPTPAPAGGGAVVSGGS